MSDRLAPVGGSLTARHSSAADADAADRQMAASIARMVDAPSYNYYANVMIGAGNFNGSVG
jgi:hypothetical protein